ncbi:PAS domain-containing protein, partial [Aquabacterium sp.]|uniref:PAS domain-containing protein n=1 Tax=Aquabacterium sp. TaxID=1872578 RepID=UPI002C177628
MKLPFRLPQGSLRARLATLLVLVSLVPLVISAYVDIRQRQAQLLDNMHQVLQARAEQLVRELDSFHRAHQRSVDRLAHFPDTADFCAANADQQAASRAAMARLLSTFPASDPAIGGAAVLDRSGKVLVATNPAVNGTDLGFRPHVRAALQGNAAVSDIHLTVAQGGEQPSISYVMPLRGPDQQVTCVALLLVRAKAIWDIVKTSNEQAGPGSFAEVFDPLGIRIAHTYSADLVFHPGGTLDAATVARLVAEQRFGTRTRALLDDVRAFPAQFERARSSAPDLSVFSGVAPVNQALNHGVARRFGTVPWTVFYMSPAANIEAQIEQMTLQKTALAGGIIVLAMGVGLFVAAGIVRPVRSLTAATAAIAGGDLSTRVADRRNDELGQLGSSFNAMAERIEQQSTALGRARDDLELRVQERTAELTRTAERLQAEVLERQRAEAAIRESQQLLQAIIDNTPAVIYVKDVQGRYMMVNRRYSELFHLRGDAVIGKSDRELFPAETAAAVGAVDQRVLDAQAPVIEEEVMPHDDGPHTYLSVKAPLRDEHGSVHGVFGISTDITERKQAEARLQDQFERLNLLDQITSAIGERQDLQSIYQVAVRSVEERLPVDFSCVCLYDELDKMLTVTRVGVRSEALAMDLAMSERSAVPIDENGLSRCVQGHLVYD